MIHMRMAMVLVLLSLTHVVCLFGQDSRASPEVRASETASLVVLSTSDEIVSRGDRMRVWFSTARNAYVSVFRIDTDGRVRMLYPERPWHNNYVQAGRMLEVRNPACDEANCAFVIDDYPGQGYIFAIASLSPFDFDAYSNGDYWDYSSIAHRGRLTGDPFLALSRLMERVVSRSVDIESSYDVYEYHVEQRFEYPRFLCYECHTFVRFPAWNPYLQTCPRFQIVRYDAPAYHPAGAYPPTRVVFSRPRQIEPRYLFTERNPADPFVSVGEERPTSPSARPKISNGATGQDVGGIGSVPAPLGRRGAVSEDDLRRLTQPDRSVREGPMSRIRGNTSDIRPQPRLLRRRQTKPDSSRKKLSRTATGRVRTKPDTSGTGRSQSQNEI
jgi:hypothetical protein